MSADPVQTYFDANTRGFLRFGQGGEVGAIHRAVWGPGVTTRPEAFRHVEDRLLSVMPERTRRVLDLGCGVGASLCHLAERRDFEGIGVTLSPVQVELATERFSSEPGRRLRCLQADFTRLPEGIAEVDFAYAIESFVLSSSPEAFFEEAARVLRPGATLVVVDDFASTRVDEGRLTFREQRWLREFQRGWHAQSVVSVERACALADEAGFALVSDEDMTLDLELRRPRDRLITAIVRLGRYVASDHPWWLNLVGGNALQMALLRRVLTYRFTVWRRR